jgi:antitoxin (DNA-binding transcriptional repressor) of toxin-antitoxin stability system
MPTVKIHQAKTHLSRLIQKACEGEEIIAARGVPAPGPFALEKGTAQARQYEGKLKIGPEFFEPLPEDELQAWE